jgi:hypothetical protein
MKTEQRKRQGKRQHAARNAKAGVLVWKWKAELWWWVSYYRNNTILKCGIPRKTRVSVLNEETAVGGAILVAALARDGEHVTRKYRLLKTKARQPHKMLVV